MKEIIEKLESAKAELEKLDNNEHDDCLHYLSIIINTLKTPKYYWVVYRNDSAYDRSRQYFETKEECYNDMRAAALSQMKCNTEYGDVCDDDTIGYYVRFNRNFIKLESCSGTYTYEIKRKFH